MPNLKAFVERGGYVVSLDALEGALNAVEQGYANSLVGYSWYGFGQTAVDVLMNKILKGEDPPDPLYTDLFIVDESNIAEYHSSWTRATSPSTRSCSRRQAAAGSTEPHASGALATSA